jgi:hypothetical protein
MQKQQFQGNKQQVNINLAKAASIVCDAEGCDNDIFMPAMKFKRISKLLTGAKEDQIAPIQVFMCTACGNINAEFDIPNE